MNGETMSIDELIDILNTNSNQEQAEKMSAYMKNRFEFLGIPKPQLKKLSQQFLTEHKKIPLDWDLVFALWNIDFREAQYVAILYLDTHKKEIQVEDFDKIKRLILTKSWWETVDNLDEYVGLIALKDAGVKEILIEWSVSDNIWLRRVAIDFQQRYKDKTDRELLEKIIINNLGSTEVLINKSIGWSLREYSKINPEWVKNFINQNRDKMNSLSIKEASKYLDISKPVIQ